MAQDPTDGVGPLDEGNDLKTTVRFALRAEQLKAQAS